MVNAWLFLVHVCLHVLCNLVNTQHNRPTSSIIGPRASLSITLWPVDDTSAFCTSSSLAAAAFSTGGKTEIWSTSPSTIIWLFYVKSQRVNRMYTITVMWSYIGKRKIMYSCLWLRCTWEKIHFACHILEHDSCWWIASV